VPEGDIRTSIQHEQRSLVLVRDAAQANNKIEPKLTLAKLRSRLVGIDERVWSKVAEGLRLAGLPD